MGSRLPKVDTGNKHVMFLSTDVLFTSDYSKEHEVSMCGMQDKWGDTVCVQHCNWKTSVGETTWMVLSGCEKNVLKPNL